MNVWHEMPKERMTSVKFPVYITITKGSNKRYRFAPQTGLLHLAEVLYAAACYPVNGGIIPRTQSEDNSPVEALVVCQESLELHTLVECSPVGAIKIQKKGKTEEKIIVIPILDNTNSIGFVETESVLKSVYGELQYFYNTYNGAVDMELRTSGSLSAIHAADRVEKAMKSYDQEYGEN